jgi:hypothetical protein
MDGNIPPYHVNYVSGVRSHLTVEVNQVNEDGYGDRIGQMIHVWTRRNISKSTIVTIIYINHLRHLLTVLPKKKMNALIALQSINLLIQPLPFDTTLEK